MDVNVRYSLPGMTVEKLGNTMILFKQRVTAPARLAGDIVLVHETMNQAREPRSAWTYNPGPAPGAARAQHLLRQPGHHLGRAAYRDQFDMFNGAIDRYDWKLVGKREMYVPYNAYRAHSGDLSFSDIIRPLHVNPEHLRYELHRVWIVDATLKEGASHLYKRRTFYIDEDSWQILLADIYDNRDQLWRVSEGHVINFYEKPLIWPTLEVHHDLQAGRYLASVSTTSSACAPTTSRSRKGTSAPHPCAAREGAETGRLGNLADHTDRSFPRNGCVETVQAKTVRILHSRGTGRVRTPTYPVTERHSRGSGNPGGVAWGDALIRPLPPLDSRFRGNDVPDVNAVSWSSRVLHTLFRGNDVSVMLFPLES